MSYVFLALAILFEVGATAALQASEQFTRVLPSVAMVLGYGISFYFMALTLRVMPVGIVYAVWSGVGIALVAVIGHLAFGQKLDLPAILGIGLILAGIVVIQMYSTTTTH